MNKEVQVYLPTYSSVADYQDINYNLVTAILYSFAYINGDGSLTYESSYNPNPLISYAHSKGCKVILSCQDNSQTDADTMLGSSANRTKCITNILNEVILRNYDGVDNDIEKATQSSTNKVNMTAFQQQLYNTFKSSNSNYRISIAIGAYYPDSDQIFDIPIIHNYADFIMIMGYDWYGDWSSTAGPNSPNLLDSGIGNYDSIKHFESEMPKNKILFGVPYYGKTFNTVGNTRLSPKVSGSTVTYAGYKDYINLVNGTSGIRIFDQIWQTPWYVYQSGSKWYQLHYDDVQSLGQKYDIVNTEGLGGIGIWEIAYGTNMTELWTLIGQKFLTCQSSPVCTFYTS